jgi:hypothetical protein
MVDVFNSMDYPRCVFVVLAFFYFPLHGILSVILMYRIHAMYSGVKTITAMLAVCFAIEVVLMVWLVMANQLMFYGRLAFFSRTLHLYFLLTGVALRAPAGNDICAIAHVLSYKYAYWIPVMAFEFLLFVLASRVFYRDLAENRQMRPWGRVSLLTLLLRDNIVYFFVYASICCFCIRGLIFSCLVLGHCSHTPLR